MKNKYPFILLAVFVLYGFLLIPLGNYKDPDLAPGGYYSVQRMDRGDDRGYFAYLRSGLIDGDFDFFNENDYHHGSQITPTGYVANFWFLGAAILWLPFFLAGHALAWVYSVLGYPVSLTGESFVHGSATFLGSATLVLAGLIVVYETCRRHYDRHIALTASLLVFVGTALPYFTFVRNRMSHSGDFFVGSLFLAMYLLARGQGKRPVAFFLVWGILGGVLFDLRYSNLVYLIFPFSLFLENILRASREHRKDELKWLGWAALSFAWTTLPQWIAWKMLNGQWHPLTSGMAIQVSASLTSVAQSVAHFLADLQWGLMFNEPLWLAGCVGWVWIFKRDRWLGATFLIAFCGFAVVPVVLGNGASFGQRYLIACAPLLAWGVAEVCQRLRAYPKSLAVAGTLCAGWIYILLLNYKTVLAHNEPAFASKALFNLPRLLQEGLIFRPTTFPDLLFSGSASRTDYLDVFFLLLFPLLFLGVSVGCVYIIRILTGVFTNRPRAWKLSVWAACLFFGLLSGFTLIQHPELPDAEKDLRRQAATARKVLESFRQPGRFNTLKGQRERVTTSQAMEHLVQGDVFFRHQQWNEARTEYLSAQDGHPESVLGLERVELMLEAQSAPQDFMGAVAGKIDRDGRLHRRAGLILLDRDHRPLEALPYLKESLKRGPGQVIAPALLEIIKAIEAHRDLLIEQGADPRSHEDLIYWMLTGNIEALVKAAQTRSE